MNNRFILNFATGVVIFNFCLGQTATFASPTLFRFANRNGLRIFANQILSNQILRTFSNETHCGGGPSFKRFILPTAGATLAAASLAAYANEDSADTPNLDRLLTEEGHAWLDSENGQFWLSTKPGLTWVGSNKDYSWVDSALGQRWLQTKSGRKWIDTPNGLSWLSTENGKRWLWTKVFTSSYQLPLEEVNHEKPSRNTQEQTQTHDKSLVLFELDKDSIQLLKSAKKISLEGLGKICRSDIHPDYIEKRYSSLESNDIHMIATFEAGEISGFAIFKNKEHSLTQDPALSSYIYLLCSESSGNGLGKSLLLSVEKQKAGIPDEITLDTEERLVPFYEKYGYTRTESLFETLFKYTLELKKDLKPIKNRQKSRSLHSGDPELDLILPSSEESNRK